MVTRWGVESWKDKKDGWFLTSIWDKKNIMEEKYAEVKLPHKARGDLALQYL